MPFYLHHRSFLDVVEEDGMSAVESFNESNRMTSSKSTERVEISLTFSKEL